MSRLFEFELDASQLVGLADGLGQLSGERLAAAAAAAVNVVVGRFDAKQRAGQIADINLDPDYIARKTRVRPATPGDTTAKITTSGDLTVMDHYPLALLTRDGTEVDKAGRRYGRRQAGVRVAIKPSAPTEQPLWFLMRLKNDNGTGVFVRTSAGKKKHMYGPSPYSLFKHQIDVGAPALLDDLQTTGAAELAGEVEKALR